MEGKKEKKLPIEKAVTPIFVSAAIIPLIKYLIFIALSTNSKFRINKIMEYLFYNSSYMNAHLFLVECVHGYITHIHVDSEKVILIISGI